MRLPQGVDQRAFNEARLMLVDKAQDVHRNCRHDFLEAQHRPSRARVSRVACKGLLCAPLQLLVCWISMLPLCSCLNECLNNPLKTHVRRNVDGDELGIRPFIRTPYAS
jgi:hypothetical protein